MHIFRFDHQEVFKKLATREADEIDGNILFMRVNHVRRAEDSSRQADSSKKTADSTNRGTQNRASTPLLFLLSQLEKGGSR